MLLATLTALAPQVEAAPISGKLQAGAAMIDITPAASSLPPGDSIRDPLMIRLSIIGNGRTCAVLAGADQPAIPQAVYDEAAPKLERITGCPRANLLISGTHTHSGSVGGFGPNALPSQKALVDALVEAATKAKKAMKPVRVAYGTTSVDLNINRDRYYKNRWYQGPNPDGPSDKTLAVVEFLDANDKPVVTYLNYAMHPIDFYLSGVISADYAGEASRYIERRYPGSVAIFALGAAGDQNPRLLRPLYNLINARTGAPNAADDRPTSPPFWRVEEKDQNRRLGVAMAQPVPETDVPLYRLRIRESSEAVQAMGSLLGESALIVMANDMSPLTAEGAIWGGNEVVQCPGRDRQDRDDPVREGSLPPYSDGAPVEMTVGLLRIGDIYISAVNGEVYSEIATRLKAVAPTSRLMMTTLANGMANSGYIYSNNAGGHLTFQVIGSRLKPGCAEDAIIDSTLRLIDKASN
jgi:hypothetical protein